MVRLAIFFTILFATLASYSQGKSVAQRLTNLVQHTDVKVSQDSLSKWITWVETGESLEEKVPVRNEAWRKFLLSFYSHQGTVPSETISEQTLQAWSQFLTFPFLTGRILDFKEIGLDQIETADIIKRSGNGKSHILLIPPFGFDGTVFETFKAAYQDRFTFHEASFPSGENTWKYPQKANYKEAVWLKKTEAVIDNYLKDLGNTNLIVLSLGSGTYTAIKLASKYKNIKSIVSLNGQYKSELVNPETGMDADISYRTSVSEKAYPTSMIIQFSPGILARNYGLTKDVAKNQAYLNQITPENANAILRYSQELRAQDITPLLEQLTTPLLCLVSKHNDASVQANDKNVIRQWKELKITFPELPVSLIEVPESQNLIFIDQPELFDMYFNKFIQNPSNDVQSIQLENEITVELPSPKASVSQVIESTQINIEYSQPALNGRKIFGELVPYNQLWRAGANEATKFHVSNDVLINDEHLLKAGSYSLFLIPEVEDWQVVFNQIPDQWGAFNYKESFDALRFRVTPHSLKEKQEFLKYEIDRQKPDVADIQICWENTTISFEVTQFFQLPIPPTNLISAPWKQLLTDEAGDGANPGLTDGKALSYIQKEDSIWFKFDLHEYNNKKAFALNILLDTDNDQSTGAAWFGQNTDYTFEKALTLWMQKSGDGFQGLNGIMYPEDFSTGNQNLAYVNNIKFYLDIDRKRYFAGVALRDLELKSKKIRVIGAVGEYQTWNDDIGDNTSALITLKK